MWGVCWKKEGRRKVEWEEDRSSVEGRRCLVMRREWRRVLPLIVTSFLSWNASGRRAYMRWGMSKHHFTTDKDNCQE